jgi:hypothetical protein
MPMATTEVELVKEKMIDIVIRRDDQDANDEIAVHLVHRATGDTVCGASHSWHHMGCPWDGREWERQGSCPGCGKPVCAYCRLVA